MSRNAELEPKNAELEVWRQRVTLHKEKLRQFWCRIEELEKSRAVITAENAELKPKVGELLKLR
uniref:Uncharacterized protein n=1 Tax=Rhizophagus irregularis (strain DAOM 181602 / DAOM 197198 / MUCL 43194) TaxID=747089 RepID=U9U727_RHIID